MEYKTNRFALFSIFLLIAAAFALQTPAQQSAGGRASTPTDSTAAKEPRTVSEFYLALPARLSQIRGNGGGLRHYFDGGFAFSSGAERLTGAALAKHRRSLIKIEDVNNGYLRLEGAWEGWSEIAIFKKAGGSYLVAVSQTGCGPGCSGEVMFLTYTNGRWSDVTRTVFPADPFNSEGYFELPRTGTTVKLKCGADNEGLELEPGECRGDTVLAEFKWDRGKFVK